jgi:hypothetical protein
VRISDFVMHEFMETFGHWPGQWRSIVPPAPDLHPADAKASSRGSIAAEGHPKRQIMLARVNPTFEVR